MVALSSEKAPTSRADSWRRVALIAGIIVMLALQTPPVDEAVHDAFSAHMIQHSVMMNVAALLLAIAWPAALGRWRESWWVAVLNALARPAPALLISTVALWVWHIPSLYNGAVESDLFHVFEHAFFLGGFVLFWRPLIDDSLNPGFLKTNGGRVSYLTMGMLAASTLAAYITFADHPLYSAYATHTHSGRSPLEDQQLGGAIMWLSGVATMIAVGLLTLRDEPEAGG